MKVLLIITGLLIMIASCGKDVNPPSFLEVDHFTLLQNLNAVNVQGELTHNFTDVRVLIDGEIIGVFELPCRLPIDYEGAHELTLLPMIRNNGISATEVVYPFVEPYKETVTLNRLETVSISPTTIYYSELNFWIEDFEDAAVKIESSIYSKTDLYKDNDPAILKYGNFYGRVDLNPTDSIWDALTSDMWIIPKGRDVYIEIDYYNTNSLLTGVMALNETGLNANTHVLLNTQYEGDVVWKKIYLDIREIVGFSVNFNNFKLMLTAIMQDNAPSTYVCIDNIKLIHF